MSANWQHGHKQKKKGGGEGVSVHRWYGENTHFLFVLNASHNRACTNLDPITPVWSRRRICSNEEHAVEEKGSYLWSINCANSVVLSLMIRALVCCPDGQCGREQSFSSDGVAMEK